MAKSTKTFDKEFSFYSELWRFYAANRGKIRSRYNDLTKKFLAYNDPADNSGAFLRPPQFEALEMYVFIKEFLDNRQVYEIFDEWRKREGKFAERSYYSISVEGQARFFDDVTEEQTDLLFKQMKAYRESYSNYIYALTMGLGKTILMATCIFYEFLLANKYPKDKRFVHNALVFAPDKTVLESLREIVTFDKSKVIPPEYARILDQNVKFHFLEDTGSSLQTLDGSDFNIIISNTQKIVVKKKRTKGTAVETLFSAKPSSLLGTVFGTEDENGEGEISDEAELIENQRFLKLTRLKQLGVYVDEAHHLFGAGLEKELRGKTQAKTSLRDTINMLAERTSIVACYNYTGTPYVKRQPLPEVVYAYGLPESINKGYLKQANVKAFENVKSEEFLKEAVTTFWARYGEHTYDGLTPKLAIFAATIEEAQDEVRPIVERIIADLGLDASKILVNVGDTKVTKDEDIRNFNDLDKPGSVGNEKQFVILVGKGREGWNCKSLFGVAMFRSPKSKIFVLQATMRCLRQITDEQHSASVFLSKSNFDILDAELEDNFNMDLDMLGGGEPPERNSYQVRVMPPPRTITLKRIWREYTLEETGYNGPIDFGLEDLDLSKYAATSFEKSKLTSQTTVKEENVDHLRERVRYSQFSLAGELARYLNLSPIFLDKILRESVDGADLILQKVNDYNEVLDDVIVPGIFHAMYEISSEIRSDDRDLVLLHEPKGRGYYEFRAKPELVIQRNSSKVTDQQRDKSFHADTYCFDSKPEQQCFWQYLEQDEVAEVYFTGMFTANQGDLAIQYYDPESRRIRSYYPDFVARMRDGSVQLVEVKGDNMIDDKIVKAKAQAATEMATAAGVDYKMYASSKIMTTNVFAPEEPADAVEPTLLDGP
ncbi:TnsA endonuclease N-terminal domain-containing protein [Schaalia sp. JY-X169]|uniref:TnsA endonuclease N-terminal domain-containing protein n=1 Tax=Schaalia sp. JY-X169 TaxID=2758572 RepID=UPI0015F74455|nr:TnsA endonuclease N-terminal domain-containing protein [Schaalia sp. JY-X169]